MLDCSDIPKQTLRYYEQEGILKSNKNSENRYRLYSIEDIIANKEKIIKEKKKSYEYSKMYPME